MGRYKTCPECGARLKKCEEHIYMCKKCSFIGEYYEGEKYYPDWSHEDVYGAEYYYDDDDD